VKSSTSAKSAILALVTGVCQQTWGQANGFQELVRIIFPQRATMVAKQGTEIRMTACIVLTTCADEAGAATLARVLVERGLAACVTRLPGVRSVYRWQGRVCEADEVQMLIKTTVARAAALIAAVAELHPYAEPELITLAATGGSAGYLQWIEDCVAGSAGD
jgi:periplasmic divalent cation tolerance protein